MRRTALLGVAVAALVLLTIGSVPLKVNAGRPASFPPPSTIKVKMYQLRANGASTGNLCFQGSRNWGCTAYCTDFLGSPCSTGGTAGYPFGTDTATVAIEGDAANNRYLRDVIPQETGPAAYHEVAIRAQAIAAHTYAYWFVLHPLAWPNYDINNSAEKQMFVPYKFDTLTTGQQTIITNALQDRYYLSQASDDSPIFSEFFADIPLRTLDGGQPYLISVADPISSHPDVPSDGHGHGLSQKGASRWARGNLSAYLGNDLGAWSVSWPERFQILTHYYTGIHVRDAGSSNAIQTPNRRFDVLWTQWARPSGYPTGLCSRVDLWLHNTGTTTWQPTEIGVGYCWGGTCTMAGYLPRQVLPGADLLVPLTVGPGSGSLYIDLYYKPAGQNSPTWFGPTTWPRQFIGSFTVVRSCRYLPAIERGYILAQ